MLKTLLNGIFPFVPYYNFLDQGRKELKIYLFLQLDEILKKISSPFFCLEQLFIDVSFLMCFSNIFVKTFRDGDRNISPGNLCYWFFKTIDYWGPASNDISSLTHLRLYFCPTNALPWNQTYSCVMSKAYICALCSLPWYFI